MTSTNSFEELNLPDPPLEYKNRKYLSVSTLLDFKRCPRRFFYRKLGLTSRVEPTALIYGSAMHKAVPVAVTQGLEPAVKAFISVWGKTTPTDVMNVEKAIASIRHFIFTHEGGKSIYEFLPPPSGTLAVDDLVSDYEIPWVLDIGLSIPLVGRIDAWVKHRDTNEKWGWEFKTVGRSIGSYFFESFEMNIQNLTYSLALRTMTGETVEGMMIEAMLKHKTKVDNMIHLEPVADHHLEDVLHWLQRTGSELLHCEHRLEEYPPEEVFIKDFSGCSAYPLFYMQSWRCEYSDLCRVADWHTMEDLYDVKPEFVFAELTIDPKSGKSSETLSSPVDRETAESSQAPPGD